MKKIIILIKIIIIILLLYLTLPRARAEEFTTMGNISIPYTEHYAMSGTAYTDHRDCVNESWNDGISANRSIDHFKGWLWLLEDGEGIEYLKANYAPYGKPGLAYICKKYGFENEDNGDISCY